MGKLESQCSNVTAAAELRRGWRWERAHIQLEKHAFEMNHCVMKDPPENSDSCTADGSCG